MTVKISNNDYKESFENSLKSYKKQVQLPRVYYYKKFIQLHKMKGACLTIGLTKLSNLIIKMEQKNSLDLKEDLIILTSLFEEELNLLKRN